MTGLRDRVRPCRSAAVGTGKALRLGTVHPGPRRFFVCWWYSGCAPLNCGDGAKGSLRGSVGPRMVRILLEGRRRMGVAASAVPHGTGCRDRLWASTSVQHERIVPGRSPRSREVDVVGDRRVTRLVAARCDDEAPPGDRRGLVVTGLGRWLASDAGMVVLRISALQHTEQGRRDDTRFTADV